MANKKNTNAKKKPGPGGRPTLYREEYATEAHLQSFVDYCKKQKEVVTLCGYAVYISVSEETFTLWKKAHPEFIGTLATIKQISKNQLFQGGLNKKLSSRIVKLGLSVNHGMNEKKETELSVSTELMTVMGVINGSTKGTLPRDDPKDSSRTS